MTDDKSATEILTVFAQYGFKKTSMEDTARAAGITRQSIYNRFGSKQAAFDWAVMIFITDMLQRIKDALTAEHSDPTICLKNAFDIWADGQFPLWCGARHGTEIRGLAMDAANRASFDLEEEFAKAISAFVIANKLADTPASANDKTFVLNLASTALLAEATSAETFSTEMLRVISTVLG